MRWVDRPHALGPGLGIGETIGMRKEIAELQPNATVIRDSRDGGRIRGEKRPDHATHPEELSGHTPSLLRPAALEELERLTATTAPGRVLPRQGDQPTRESHTRSGISGVAPSGALLNPSTQAARSTDPPEGDLWVVLPYGRGIIA